MPIELPINKQGFPNLLSKLGVIPPQQGPLWTFTPLIQPTVIVGADTEISTTPPRFRTTQIVVQSVADPINGSLLAASPPLKRGRYVFYLIWAFNNNDAANNLELEFLSRDENGLNQQFVFLDQIEVAGNRRSNSREETTFTMDLLDDRWTTQFVTVTGGPAPVGSRVTVQQMFHKYADFPNDFESDTF